ncbi:SRPBCC family protein [Micromonospora tarensis]|uniref:SRPBCC family protein n=1 Tax=Micromonospora tarensis TaxID=2806100 RepID=A0ABS1YDV5_9ACTN|nr:SRPBCC family protein [Micromonospora tarensis]MBM0275429.1 SRPBCC family protein [Micromonospora tarensis]
MTAEPYPLVHWPPGWGPDQSDSFVAHERRIPAPAAVIFGRLIAIAEWPTWQHSVDRAESAGDIAVGSTFLVVTRPHVLDGIVGELDPPSRFGWVAVGDDISFYQTWLLLNEADGGTRTIFQEAARGPAALLRAQGRAALTRGWLEALLSQVTNGADPRTWR